MQFTIFGATGKTGRQLVRQALDRGHSVRAFVRDPGKLALSSNEVEIVQGDILDRQSVDRALADPVDAVFMVLGIFSREPTTELSEGSRNIVDAMVQLEIKRLAVVSSLGVGDSAGQGNLLARGLQKFLLKHVLADKERQEAYIASSGLDWTIVRPPQLTDGADICENVIAWQGVAPRTPPITWRTTRATVANFMLDAVENGSYINCAMNISEPK